MFRLPQNLAVTSSLEVHLRLLAESGEPHVFTEPVYSACQTYTVEDCTEVGADALKPSAHKFQASWCRAQARCWHRDAECLFIELLGAQDSIPSC